MQKSEPKRPIGVPQSIYDNIERYAQENTMFIFEVVVKMWEEFSKRHTLPVKKKRKN